MTTKKSDYTFSQKQKDVISDIVSGTYGEKIKQSNDYIYNLVKVFFKIDNNKGKIPSYISNVAAYKLDDNSIKDAEFEKMVKTSPAGNSERNSITTNHPLSLEQLQKINVNTNVLEELGTHSKSAYFFLEILKSENEYILMIEKD